MCDKIPVTKPVMSLAIYETQAHTYMGAAHAKQAVGGWPVASAVREDIGVEIRSFLSFWGGEGVG